MITIQRGYGPTVSPGNPFDFDFVPTPAPAYIDGSKPLKSATGTLIAATYSDFLANTLSTDMVSAGVYPAASPTSPTCAWTGVTSNSDYSEGNTCTNWASTSGNGGSVTTTQSTDAIYSGETSCASDCWLPPCLCEEYDLPLTTNNLLMLYSVQSTIAGDSITRANTNSMCSSGAPAVCHPTKRYSAFCNNDANGDATATDFIARETASGEGFSAEEMDLEVRAATGIVLEAASPTPSPGTGGWYNFWSGTNQLQGIGGGATGMFTTRDLATGCRGDLGIYANSCSDWSDIAGPVAFRGSAAFDTETMVNAGDLFEEGGNRPCTLLTANNFDIPCLCLIHNAAPTSSPTASPTTSPTVTPG